MAGEWVDATLGDLVEIGHGFAFQGEYFHDEPPGDVLLTPGNFATGGGFKTDKFKYYRGPVPEDFVLSEGDLLVTMTDLSRATDTLGYPALVPRPGSGARFLHNQRLGKVVIKAGAPLEKSFVYYLLCGREYRNEVLASATGTTVKHTSPERIKRFRFQRPPLSEQRAIAHILGGLDDKIELNRRMSETLEAMARALFKSWFVDFDPVRAKAEGCDSGLPKRLADLFSDSFEESELGEIPEGWSARSLPEVIEVNPPRSLRPDDVAPYLDMANMPTRTYAPEDWVERAFGSGMRFMNGDTLVARITPCLENGKTAFIDFLEDGEIGWGSTEYIVLRPKPPLPPVFAYCLARGAEFREFAIQRMTGSSGRQRVPTEALGDFLLAVPPGRVAELFAGMVEPLFARSKTVIGQSRSVIALRNALLPKLISGELRIASTDRTVGSEVA
jgi:type I restriction enzyme S subunit